MTDKWAEKHSRELLKREIRIRFGRSRECVCHEYSEFLFSSLPRVQWYYVQHTRLIRNVFVRTARLMEK